MNTLSPMNKLASLARKEVRELASYNAGLSADAVRNRYAVDTISKLGSNENPIGVSPQVLAAMQNAITTTGIYPDADCSLLRQTLARQLHIPAERFVFGNGSEDLISIISRVFLDHSDEVITTLPSFGLHIIYPEAVGATVTAVPLTADAHFDTQSMINMITYRTRLIMFASPSNPVGCIMPPEELQMLLAAMPDHCLMVFDEAYFEYANASGQPYADYLNLLEQSGKSYILLRTFSKAYALAGLRIGYGIVSDAVFADLINRVRTPFNINSVAQAAAVAALTDTGHLRICMKHVYGERRRMTEKLQEFGVPVNPSYGNFLFIPLQRDAAQFAEALLARGIIVKAWKEKGYTDYIRVSIGSTFDNNRFLDAFMTIRTESE